MKVILFSFLAAIGSTLASPPMTARFDNGDSITGMLGDIDGDSFVWKSDAFTQDQLLKLDRLVDVSIANHQTLELPEGDHIAVVTLTNGDIVRGSLTSLSDKQVILRTSFADDLVFRRDMVASLRIEDRPVVLYSGPLRLDEWNIQTDGGWTFERGELVSRDQTSISRDIGKHDQFRLSFDIAWRGNARFRVFACADNTDRDSIENSFELVCHNQYAYMRKHTKRNGQMQSDQVGSTSGVREFQEREKVRVELFFDLVAGRIRFMLDGRVVSDWREPAPGMGEMGGVLHFLSDSGNEVRISRIRASSWDGSIDGKWQEAGPDPFGDGIEEDEEVSKEHLTGILLRNGDRIEGSTIGIDDGKVALKTGLGKLQLPVSRLRSFALRTPEEAANPELTWKPILKNGDIRAHFTEGDHITFQLVGFEEDAIRGYSQTFGEADFQLSAFNRLEFNIYSTDSDPGW